MVLFFACFLRSERKKGHGVGQAVWEEFETGNCEQNILYEIFFNKKFLYHKTGKLKQMGEFLAIYNLSNLNQDQMSNINRPS